MDAKRKLSEEKDLYQNDEKRKKIVTSETQEAGESSNDINMARSFSNIEELNGLINIPIMSFNSQENTVIDGSVRGGSSGEGLANELSLVVSEFVEVDVKSEEEINKKKDEWKGLFDVNKASKGGRSKKK